MFLGTRREGALWVRCPASASMEQTDRLTLHDFPDGSRAATIYGALTAPRTWTIGYGGLRPGDAALMSSFAGDRAWYTQGDVFFIPPGGHRTNVLTREESTLRDVPGYVGEILPFSTEGVVMGYLLDVKAVRVASYVPLPRTGTTTPLTISLLWSGSKASATVWYRSSTGGTVGSETVTFSTGGSTLHRDYATLTRGNSAIARYADIEVTGDFITRPQLTYGDEQLPWGEGTRIPSVIVTQQSSEIQWAGSRTVASYSRAGYTITELRNGGAA